MRKPKLEIRLHSGHPGHNPKRPRNEIRVPGYRPFVVKDGEAMIERGSNLEPISFGPFLEDCGPVTHATVWMRPRGFWRRLWRWLLRKPNHVLVAVEDFSGDE